MLAVSPTRKVPQSARWVLESSVLMSSSATRRLLAVPAIPFLRHIAMFSIIVLPRSISALWVNLQIRSPYPKTGSAKHGNLGSVGRPWSMKCWWSKWRDRAHFRTGIPWRSWIFTRTPCFNPLSACSQLPQPSPAHSWVAQRWVQRRFISSRTASPIASHVGEVSVIPWKSWRGAFSVLLTFQPSEFSSGKASGTRKTIAASGALRKLVLVLFRSNAFVCFRLILGSSAPRTTDCRFSCAKAARMQGTTPFILSGCWRSWQWTVLF